MLKIKIPKETPNDCADLISHLLVKDPLKRLTAEEVKNQQWLIDSLANKKLSSFSKFNSKMSKSSYSFKLKWVSSPRSIITDNIDSNFSTFNLKYAQIIPTHLTPQRRNIHG
jgi:serine/threonine protein kinase